MDNTSKWNIGHELDIRLVALKYNKDKERYTMYGNYVER